MPLFDLSNTAPEGFIQMMEETVWGSAGGFQYKQTNVRERIKEGTDSYYLTLQKRGNLLAGVNIYLKSQHPDTLYIRYFSFSSSAQIKDARAKKRTSNSIIRSEIDAVFSKGSLLQEGSSAIYYAFVEMENERSREMCESFGFTPIRRLSTHIFSRIRSKKHPEVRKLDASLEPFVEKKLKHFYANYSTFNAKIKRENYYLFIENGEPICGFQVLPVRWKIENAPGISGQLMLNVFPRLPFLSRVFQPDNFRFLAIDQIFVEPGRNESLNRLISSVCSELNYHFVFAWADTESSLNDTLAGLDKGLTGKIQPDVPANIIARFPGLSTIQKEGFINNPLYIDPRDLT